MIARGGLRTTALTAAVSALLGCGNGAPGSSSPEGGATCAADTMSDAKNCGRCGHDCQGGACTAGVCQPIVLASGLNNPWGIAVDGTNVYWTNGGTPNVPDGTVMQVPAVGGSATQIASGQNHPAGIAVHATDVYWVATNGNALMRAPIGGGSVTTLASGLDLPLNLTLYGVTVYCAGQGLLESVPLDGGAVSTLAGGGSINGTLYGVAVGPEGVYFTTQPNGALDPGDVLTMSLDGGAAAIFASGMSTSAITMDSANVYWVDGYDIRGKPVGPAATSPAQWTSQVMATGYLGNAPTDIVVDATNVYFTITGPSANGLNPGMVLATPLGEKPLDRTVLAQNQVLPRGIAADTASVYWVNAGSGKSDGAVMKVAKP